MAKQTTREGDLDAQTWDEWLIEHAGPHRWEIFGGMLVLFALVALLALDAELLIQLGAFEALEPLNSVQVVRTADPKINRQFFHHHLQFLQTKSTSHPPYLSVSHPPP